MTGPVITTPRQRSLLDVQAEHDDPAAHDAWGDVFLAGCRRCLGLLRIRDAFYSLPGRRAIEELEERLREAGGVV